MNSEVTTIGAVGGTQDNVSIGPSERLVHGCRAKEGWWKKAPEDEASREAWSYEQRNAFLFVRKLSIVSQRAVILG